MKDHLLHGPTVEHNSDTGERGLKQWAKKVALTAQKRGDTTFKEQVAINTINAEILEMLDASCGKLRMGLRTEMGGVEQKTPLGQNR